MEMKQYLKSQNEIIIKLKEPRKEKSLRKFRKV